MTLVLMLSLLSGATEPPLQSRVFFNARIALREGRNADALTLWLMRNTLVDTGHPAPHDGEFLSVLWAATGALAVCQEGLAEDSTGLWPLALHNYVLRGVQSEPLPPAFDAFDVGRQQRLISLSDVLSQEELGAVSFFRTSCNLPLALAGQLDVQSSEDLDDRLVKGNLMRWALARALETLKREKVTTVAAIEARLFGLDLALIELRLQRVQSASREAAAAVRELSMSRGAAQQTLERTLTSQLEPNRPFLERALGWTPEAWLTLSRERRGFLFGAAKTVATPEQLRTSVLAMVDALAARDQGSEVSQWLGALPASARAEVFDGARGERLLALSEGSGFRERSVLALHRGVAALERKELVEALRLFAFALAHSGESTLQSTVHPLARRWLSYVLARYQATPEVLATLRSLVSRQDFTPIVEELAWAAALRADAPSYTRVMESLQRGTSAEQQLQRLARLAEGNPGAFIRELEADVAERPYEVLRFGKVIVERVEREVREVRGSNRALLEQLRRLFTTIATRQDVGRTNARSAGELVERTQALLEAMSGLSLDDENARSQGLGYAAFAGSVRLAPADPLPWPFAFPEVPAPSVFAPMVLTPLEWRDADGALVFGWRISE